MGCSCFSATISLKEGMKLTYDAYIKNNFQHGIDWKYEGETDCVINSWCKLNHIDTCEMNLRFIDYLGNAGWEDKVIYYLFRYHKCYAVRIFLLMCKIGRKLIRKIV